MTIALPHIPPAVLRTVQIAVTVGLLAIIVVHVDIAEVGRLLAGTDVVLAISAVAVLLGGQIVSALRWRRLAAGLKLRASRTWFVAAYLRGCLFNTLLPTAVGGDAVKVHLLRALGPWRAGLRSVLLDRVLGLAALAGAAAMTAPLSAYIDVDAWVRIVLALASAYVLLVVLWIAARRFGLAVLRWSVAYVAIWSVGVYLLAAAIGVGLPLVAVPTLVLVVSVISALPVSVGGLGAREATFAVAVGPLGIAADRGVALGVAFGLALIAVGLVSLAVPVPGSDDAPRLDDVPSPSHPVEPTLQLVRS